MRSFKFSVCSIAVVAMLVSAGIARADDYKIKLSRPQKVGDEYTNTVTAKISRTVTVTANGVESPAKSEKFKAECHGKLKVLAVNDKTGSPTKIRYEVDKMTKDGDEFYPQGTVITVDRNGHDTVFEIDGEHPDAEHAEVLEALIGVSSTTEQYDDDQMIGTDKPQQIGGSWPIDAEKNAKSMAEDELPFDASKIKGESKLVEVKDIDGVRAMVVNTTMTADGLKTDVPNGLSVSDGKIAVNASETLPLDASQNALRSTVKTSLELIIQLPQGAGTSTMKIEREVKEVREPAARQ